MEVFVKDCLRIIFLLRIMLRLGTPKLKILSLLPADQFLMASPLHQLSLVKDSNIVAEPAGGKPETAGRHEGVPAGSDL